MPTDACGTCSWQAKSMGTVWLCISHRNLWRIHSLLLCGLVQTADLVSLAQQMRNWTMNLECLPETWKGKKLLMHREKSPASKCSFSSILQNLADLCWRYLQYNSITKLMVHSTTFYEWGRVRHDVNAAGMRAFLHLQICIVWLTFASSFQHLHELIWLVATMICFQLACSE